MGEQEVSSDSSGGLPVGGGGLSALGSMGGNLDVGALRSELDKAIDPSTKWLHYAAGALAPGRFDASMRGGLGALADSQDKESELKAKYLPIIAQAMLQQQQNQLAQSQAEFKIRKEWSDRLTGAVTGLMSNPDATTNDAAAAISQESKLSGIPVAFAQQYFSAIPKTPEGLRDFAKRNGIAQMDPAGRLKEVTPNLKSVNTGAEDVLRNENPNAPLPVGATVGPGVKMGMSPKDRLSIQLGPNGPRITDLATANAGGVGTPAGRDVAASVMGPGGAPPGAAPPQQPPQGAPPGPGGAPPLQALPAGPPPVANVPPASSLYSLAPSQSAGAQLPGAQPPAQPTPQALAAALQSAAPRTAAPPSQTTAPPLGAPPPVIGDSSAVDPARLKQREQLGGDVGKYETELNDKASSMSDLSQRINAMRESVQNFQPGATAGARLKAGAFLKDTTLAMGLSPEKANALGDKVANGSIASMQEFQKLAVASAMEALTSFVKSGRITNMEVQSFRDSNPRLEMDPQAMNKVMGFIQHQMQKTQAEQSFVADYRNNTSNDPLNVRSAWAQESRRLFPDSDPSAKPAAIGGAAPPTSAGQVGTDPKTGRPIKQVLVPKPTGPGGAMVPTLTWVYADKG